MDERELPKGIIPELRAIVEKIEADKTASGGTAVYRRSEYGHLLLAWEGGIWLSAQVFTPEEQREYLRKTALYAIEKMGPQIIPLLREELRAVLTEEELECVRKNNPGKGIIAPMSPEFGSVSIDPTKKEEYLQAIDRLFDEWHQKKWWLVSKEYFMEISRASFLAYLKYMVGNSDEQGGIDREKMEAGLKEQLGVYFRSEKFETALEFLQKPNWEEIVIV